VNKFNVLKPANSKHRSKVISDEGTFAKDTVQMAAKQQWHVAGLALGEEFV